MIEGCTICGSHSPTHDEFGCNTLWRVVGKRKKGKGWGFLRGAETRERAREMLIECMESNRPYLDYKLIAPMEKP